MRTFEFVKVGKVWFYWWPDYDKGGPEDLAMVDGADKLLDSLGGKFAKVQLADLTLAEIVLSKIEENEWGATYYCRSKNYNGTVWICTLALFVFGEYPQNIYLKDIQNEELYTSCTII